MERCAPNWSDKGARSAFDLRAYFEYEQCFRYSNVGAQTRTCPAIEWILRYFGRSCRA